MSNKTPKTSRRLRPKPPPPDEAAEQPPVPAPIPAPIMLTEQEERVLSLFQFRASGSLEDASAAIAMDVLHIRRAMQRLSQTGLLQFGAQDPK